MSAATASWLLKWAGPVPVAPAFEGLQAVDNPVMQLRDPIDRRRADGHAIRLTAHPRVPGVHRAD